jgi:hypothetical protein
LWRRHAENPCHVILHDYTDRPNYMIVEKVAKIEQHTGKGILLSKRPDVTEADLYDLWKRFMNAPGWGNTRCSLANLRGYHRSGGNGSLFCLDGEPVRWLWGALLAVANKDHTLFSVKVVYYLFVAETLRHRFITRLYVRSQSFSRRCKLKYISAPFPELIDKVWLCAQMEKRLIVLASDMVW